MMRNSPGQSDTSDFSRPKEAKERVLHGGEGGADQACSRQEVMAYIAEMSESLAKIAQNADRGEVSELLAAAGRQARRYV